MVLRAPWRGTAIAVRERREEKNSPEQRAISSKCWTDNLCCWDQNALAKSHHHVHPYSNQQPLRGEHIRNAHKVSAEWDSADKIIPLFYLSEGSQVWIWRAIFQDFPPCKFKSKWLYAGASLTPPSCQGWFKISEREVSRAGFLNRLFSLHCSMAQCSVLSRSLNFQHWYIPCVLCSWWASIWCWGWSNGPHGGGVWGAINSLLVLWWNKDCVWLEERKIRRKWAGGDTGDLFARI